jgi:hypothetical protein
MSRQIGRTVRFLVGTALLISLLTVVCTTPAAHEVRSSGAVPVRIQAFSLMRPFSAAVTPTQSLTDLRCQLWKSFRGPTCPDELTLALQIRFFPDFAAMPRAVFVGLLYPCGQLSAEYTSQSRTLVFHCYYAAPWLQIPYGPASMPFPATTFVMASTEDIRPGQLRIDRDDRIEHWVFDQSSEYQIGAVTAS